MPQESKESFTDLPVYTVAVRMAVVLCVVAALCAAAAWFLEKPRLWCTLIPFLIPLSTPFVLRKSRGSKAKN